MVKWEIKSCSPNAARSYLEEGWEPFAVTCMGNVPYATIWLRRKIQAKKVEGA